MTSEEPKHPTFDNEIKINLPMNRQVWVRDFLGCKQGIHNKINVKSHNEDILIESSVDPLGNNDLKVYKNNLLIKHVINGVNKTDEQKVVKSDQKNEENTQSQQNDSKTQNLSSKQQNSNKKD